MTQAPRQSGQGTRRVAGRAAENDTLNDTLMQAKMALVAAQDRGEAGTLTNLLASYPQHASELTVFSAALIATTSYEHEDLTPETEGIAARALSRAMAAVFTPTRTSPAGTVAQKAAASLKALRQARQITIKNLAEQLGLGRDIVNNLEAGVIRVATIPERVLHGLSDALDASVDQVRLALQTQAALTPALLRSREGQTRETPEQPELDFAEAVRLSPDMSAEQKARWLADETH